MLHKGWRKKKKANDPDSNYAEMSQNSKTWMWFPKGIGMFGACCSHVICQGVGPCNIKFTWGDWNHSFTPTCTQRKCLKLSSIGIYAAVSANCISIISWASLHWCSASVMPKIVLSFLCRRLRIKSAYFNSSAYVLGVFCDSRCCLSEKCNLAYQMLTQPYGLIRP
jgi:hypothetical protein